MKKGFKSTVVRDLVPRCGGEERRTDKADAQTQGPLCLCQPYTFSDGRGVEVPEKDKGVAAGLRVVVLTFPSCSFLPKISQFER